MDGRFLLENLENQKKMIEEQYRYGIISFDDTLNEIEMIKKKENKIKEKLVLERHITRTGEVRKISYLENMNLYSTKLENGQKVRSKTYEGLIDKLFKLYELEFESYTVDHIFELAFENKKRTKNDNMDTLIHNRSEYKRFFNQEIRNKDIRSIDDEYLQEYSLNLVRTKHPKTKAFDSYKGILNLIFEYALRKKIIAFNPVDCLDNNDLKKSCIPSTGTSETKLFSQDEIKLIEERVRHQMTFKRYKGGYFINGYAILFSIQTGMRVAEICSLKWEDISDSDIHIHSQQLHSADTGKYNYANWTKNERGRSKGGRYFPLTEKIKDILIELTLLQKKLGISSEFVFCNLNGEWMKAEAYESTLRRICQRLNFKVTNNHAFRMSLNSNIFIPLGMPVTMRAELLGHDVSTNEKYYSFATKDNTTKAADFLNKSLTPNLPLNDENVVSFEQRKTLETASFQGFKVI